MARKYIDTPLAGCRPSRLGGDGLHDPHYCVTHAVSYYGHKCPGEGAFIQQRVAADTARMPPATKPALPTDSAERKRWPLFSGLLRYFPAALANVSNHSFLGNEKHNPGMPMQHARNKSSDHEDCIMRHLMDAAEHKPGSAVRIDELRGVAWRALALLQVECEIAGYQLAPAATFTDKETNANT